MIKKHLVYSLIALSTLFACQQDDSFVEEEEIQVIKPEFTDIKGFYLLNEGNMGTNKASIDFFDYETGTYRRNIFQSANPTIVKALGDVGNDIKIYGNKLYAVINVSNIIEVMDVKTAKLIGTIPLINCRYITFDNGKAYASSYARSG